MCTIAQRAPGPTDRADRADRADPALGQCPAALIGGARAR